MSLFFNKTGLRSTVAYSIFYSKFFKLNFISTRVNQILTAESYSPVVSIEVAIPLLHVAEVGHILVGIPDTSDFAHT